MAVKYSTKSIIEALSSLNGMVYLAARKLGCTPQTIYNRMKSSVAIREACDNARGETDSAPQSNEETGGASPTRPLLDSPTGGMPELIN